MINENSLGEFRSILLKCIGIISRKTQGTNLFIFKCNKEIVDSKGWMIFNMVIFSRIVNTVELLFYMQCSEVIGIIL